jgi:hypothetical protein
MVLKTKCGKGPGFLFGLPVKNPPREPALAASDEEICARKHTNEIKPVLALREVRFVRINFDPTLGI